MTLDDGREVAVTDNSRASRFEVHVGGELAGYTTYRDVHLGRAFEHTEIASEFEGLGLASRLIEQALNETRAARLRVLPFCPFVRAYIERHPDYLALVDVPERFGLTRGPETDVAAPIRTWSWGSGPDALVFLHALLPASTGRSIEPAAVDLTGRLPIRVIGIDAPGFGESAPVPDEAYDLGHLSDLLAGAAQEAVGSRYVLAGHSWGAALAVRIAAERPDQVRGVVLMDGGHFDHAALPEADPRQSVPETVAEMEDIGWHYVDHPGPLPPAWAAGLRPAGDGRWESTAGRRAAGAAMNHLMRARTTAHYPALAARGVPVLLLTATEPEQRRLDNEQRTRQLLEGVPQARAYRLSGSGHDVLADAPDQVADRIAVWWRSELGTG